ncbi:acyltransferase [Sphingomonas sp. HITSZ_GF]|uniref:acyltransferase family protein n=1 Tax=Sphingomonas sp. HITSZ_GF TaxID=3037247 RepID=UPI00240E0952|nr:acyltransferase [Sphingomonas sp. HITSZ_GF]MDG2534312.1 acyltransferase [Sphingomonas sp. HITSZ_GF]
MRGPELKALTSVRGIAAWFVVLFHIRFALGLPDPEMHLLAKGYLAVDFFFLLSGFVIWMTWGDRIRTGGLSVVPGFLRRRIARVWPLHLVLLAFGVAIAATLELTGRGSDQFPWHELPLHILLLQNWGFTEHLTWNDPAWSISCELAAYLLFPLLALAMDWRRVPSWGLIAAVAALLALLHAIFASRGAWALGQEILQLGLIRCLIEFAAGTAIGALWLRWREHWRLPALLSFGLALAFAAGWALGLPETLAAPATFAALLLGLALTSAKRGNPLEIAPLHYLGEISYATYLSHYLLWFAFKLAFVENEHAVPWPMVAGFLLLVLLASVALYHLVERPAQKWVNALKLLPGTGRGTAPLQRRGGGGPPSTSDMI